eukprot:COSAG03_NODE_4897_length_1405_cov_1.088258_1_plen_59_part_10
MSLPEHAPATRQQHPLCADQGFEGSCEGLRTQWHWSVEDSILDRLLVWADYSYRYRYRT